MQQWVLPYLCDPKTKEPLKLIVRKKRGTNIIEGELVAKSGARYPIRKGVPRFVEDTFQKPESVESFGFEWNTLNFDAFYQSWKNDIAERNFGSSRYFRGKLIVECGAGTGMHTRWMLEAGAKRVIALELSNTVDQIMQQNLKGFEDRCVIIQADISNPPIKPNSVNGIIYCINVIQHTKDPLDTTAKNLYALLDKGICVFNIYMTRGKKYLYLDLHYHLRKITVHLPKKLLLGLCYIGAVLDLIPGIHYIAERTVILTGDRSWKNLRRRYKGSVTNTYDYYGGHEYQYIYTAEQIAQFFKRWGIQKSRIKNYDAYMTGAPAPGLALQIKK
jgi:uncharacterized protein YbaR (Trm112 family)